jgi:uncharacterized protein YxjI
MILTPSRFIPFLCILFGCGVHAANIEVPEQFFVNQRYLSWTTSFDIETPDSTIGTVHRRLLSLLHTQYDFYDFEEQLQATAQTRFWALGVIFDVTDGEGKLLGCVRQQLLSFFPTFEILSPSGQILAVAEMNFWGTTYLVKDASALQKMATLSRSFFRLRDNWSVTIDDPELFKKMQIDPRLFITLMAFQTDFDHWRRHSQ